MFIEFPKYRYHRTLAPVVVNSPEEEQELGEDYADSPAAFIDAPAVPEVKAKRGK